MSGDGFIGFVMTIAVCIVGIYGLCIAQSVAEDFAHATILPITHEYKEVVVKEKLYTLTYGNQILTDEDELIRVSDKTYLDIRIGNRYNITYSYNTTVMTSNLALIEGKVASPVITDIREVGR